MSTLRRYNAAAAEALMRRHQRDADAAARGPRPRPRRSQTADAQTATSRGAGGMGPEATEDSDAFHGHILERVQTLLNESLHAAESEAAPEQPG